MSKYTFLFKDYNNNQDRDCVAYVEISALKDKHVCIDGKFNIHGACYSMSFNDRFTYENTKTILAEDEFLLLQNGKVTDNIIAKLESNENKDLFEEVIEEEREYLRDVYGLDDDDIEQIFNEYYLDYRDRGIISYIFKDSEDLGYEEAYSLGYINDKDSISSRYFDYEKFGEDLLEEENYLELCDGRVAVLNY